MISLRVLIYPQKIPSFLIDLFAFLGPLGTLLSPSLLPYQFRAFYILLCFFPLFLGRLYHREFKILSLFLPFLFYLLISAYFAEFKEDFSIPLKRALLFIFEFFFVFGSAFYLRNSIPSMQKNRLIKIYLYGFFISLIVGYFFFIGFYLQWIPLATIQRFSVITQFGYGFLRFSPGSYPNEYGTVASFVCSILTFLIAEKSTIIQEINFKTSFLYLFFLLAFMALLLTTTRSAYITFVISMMYLFCTSFKFRKLFFTIIFFSIITLLFVSYYFPLLLKVFISSFKALFYQSESVQIRLSHWGESMKSFDLASWFGTGYGTLFYMHNVYIQLLLELGVFGFICLLFFLLSLFLNYFHQLKSVFFKHLMSKKELFSNRVITLGLIHILFFAGSNHNLNHHLTWMVFLLLNITLFSQKAILPDSNRKNQA